MKTPLIAICRHRLGSDGQGVTTLVAFHGCPLRCRYCLNPHCLRSDGVWRQMDAYDLLKAVQTDDLYFQATGGGVTFGGGEPLLRSDEIELFCNICPPEWHITLETSLNVERRRLEQVAPYVTQYIIDVKDMNPDIYRRYTGRTNRRVLGNLRWLSNHADPESITVRLPLIPGYNTEADRDASRQRLSALGLNRFDCFTYIVNH